MTGPRPVTPSVPDISSYEVGELLYELPGVACACPWEPFLNDLNGLDGQGEIGGDPKYLFIGGRTARIWRKGALGALARSHVFILSVGEGEGIGV